MTSVRIHAIPAVDLNEIRRRGRDGQGHRPEPCRAGGGEPLRCCLRQADEGEELWLISHAPLAADRPWREWGPVFIHAERCDGPVDGEALPALLTERRVVLRSYTATGEMDYDANEVVEPGRVGPVLERLLARPGVSEVHVRNVVAQCFLARATREAERR